MVLNEEERKQEGKANRIILLDGGMTRRSNYNLNLRKLRINKITVELQSGSKWKTYRLSTMIFEDKGNFAVYDKDCRHFLTPRKHARHAIR